jgi:hypothetical protein
MLSLVVLVVLELEAGSSAPTMSFLNFSILPASICSIQYDQCFS